MDGHFYSKHEPQIKYTSVYTTNLVFCTGQLVRNDLIYLLSTSQSHLLTGWKIWLVPC